MEMRNLFGVLVPGALFLLAIILAIATSPFTHGCWHDLDSWSGSHMVLAITILFLLSYLSGSLFRLNSAGNLDKWSGRANLGGCVNNSLDDVWNKLTSTPLIYPDLNEVMELWSSDHFPYPVFQLWRIVDKCPEGYQKSLQPLLSRMTSGAPGEGRKSPFNYCKMIVFAVTKDLGDELIREIRSKETEVRYFAGTFYALLLGILTVLVLIASQIISIFPVNSSVAPAPISAIITTFVVAIVLAFANWKIMVRFRTLRIREVDIVLDAYAFGVAKGFIPQPDWPTRPSLGSDAGKR
jgi:hypothetical protein